MVTSRDKPYNTPAYPLTDAARYLHIPVATLRSWLQGRSYPTKHGQKNFAPLLQRPDPESSQLSFTNLIEAHVLRIIREQHQIRLDKVRAALDYVSQAFDTDHPLATERFKTDGVDLFIEQVDKLVIVSRLGQLGMKQVFHQLLTRIEWDPDGLANRFFPTSVIPDPATDKLIYIDPAIRFGRPILARTGIPTYIIADLYNAGDSLETIAQEYDCTEPEILTAIQFESQNRAA
ncbi:MAG: DUF433 domain-containing protein [Synechococcaceae cyanobacterium SM2_3_2]|nr:DUF433 domain-containing protein [Synechococcaceae cyanobacterium SM2_3_2]